MALSSVGRQMLDGFNRTLEGTGQFSLSGHSSTPGRAVQIFIAIEDAGDTLHPDEVRDWAIEKGWESDDARDLGEWAEAVHRTLQQLRRDGRLRSVR